MDLDHVSSFTLTSCFIPSQTKLGYINTAALSPLLCSVFSLFCNAGDLRPSEAQGFPSWNKRSPWVWADLQSSVRFWLFAVTLSKSLSQLCWERLVPLMSPFHLLLLIFFFFFNALCAKVCILIWSTLAGVFLSIHDNSPSGIVRQPNYKLVAIWRRCRAFTIRIIKFNITIGSKWWEQPKLY